MQSISIETSVVNFLRENPSASPESVERQLITRRWWNRHRQRYELVTSQYVVDEANMGNPARAQERVRYLAGIPLVVLSSEIDDLAAQIIARSILPKVAIVDAEIEWFDGPHAINGRGTYDFLDRHLDPDKKLPRK
ncbi:MAG: hypothetical protein WCJ31_00860 [Planctomycetia bacterium]